ncbi:23S rRNA (guanosine(2251)-2'-O)-methyltransferase RlmB [Endothiovibrio diazotrophicus]
MSSDELLFGIHAVEAALKSDSVTEVVVAGGRHDGRMQGLLHQAGERSVTVREVSRRELDELARGQRHQGVIAYARAAKVRGEGELHELLDRVEGPPFLLILDGVTDPHNLGACLRSADAAGVHGVVAPRDKAAGLNATVRKVASGAAETTPFFQVTNLARTLRELQDRGIWLVGAAGEAEADLYAVDLKGPLAVVMGAEGKGLRRLTREHCDTLAKIPMAGAVESLNVSVATGIFLFEALRQRR